MRVGHEKMPRAWNLHTMHLGNDMGCTHMLPLHAKMRGASVFFCFCFWVKPALLAQTQVKTLTINTSIPRLEFLVQNCAVQEEGNFEASGEFLSSP